MARLVGQHPYAEVRCYWCESTGRFALKKMMNDWSGWITVGVFDSKQLAQEAQDKLWAEPHEGMASTTVDQMVRMPDGSEMASEELPPGAMYDGEHLHEMYPMSDGISLVVVLPNGYHWHVDSRANNCTLPDDEEHTCWVRRGDPRKGMCHVERQPGDFTCSAGHNSIACFQPGTKHHYHGHLKMGVLTAG